MDPVSSSVLEGLVGAVTERVFAAVTQAAAPKVRAWLKREPARLAFQTALLRAVDRFAEAHPAWAASLLDKTFFTHKVVTRELARFLTRRDAPDVNALAAAWAAQLPGVGERHRDEAARALADFLRTFEEELGNQEALQPLFDSRALERIAARAKEILETLREQHAAALRAADRGVRIAGNVHHALIVTGDHNTVQVFLGATPVDHRPRVQRFLEEYLGTPSRPVPFGGRAADLQRLSAWLESEARPYFFLHAPAGRGKSALLTRWAAAMAREEAWAVVFVPVSLRFDTHRPSVFLALLAHGLAKVYEGDEAKLTEKDPDVLLSMAAGYLRRPEPPSNRRGVLVVLDGLDEAAWPPNGEAWRTLFPGEPPAHLRVAASARVLATADVPAWLRRLGWRQGRTATHELRHLSLEGVREVLAQMQVPLDALSRDVDLVQTLYRLTDQGDPLPVGIYAQSLLDTLEDEGEEAARTKAGQIAQLVGSGYATFFEDFWWPEQRKLWAERGLPGETEAHVREILDLLALARGPIPEADLLALARRAADMTALDTYVLDQVWENLARVVIRRREGKHTLVTFSHPRMREYFAEERLQRRDPTRYRDLETRYRDWMRAEVSRIAEGEAAAPDASPYVLRYALDHLVEEPLETWRRLVERPAWHRTRHAQEGDYVGFLEDVQAVWKRATAENCRRLEATSAEGQTPPCHLPHIGLEIRCALVEASIHSLAGNLPEELPARLVENDLWTPAQALAHLRQMPGDEQRVEALRSLVPVLAQKAPAWLAEALHAARQLPEQGRFGSPRARALAALAPHLPADLLAEILDATQSIEDEWHRAEALATLAPHLPEGLLAEALAAARNIRDYDACTQALAALALYLPDDLRQQALAETLAAAQSIEDEWHRAEALATLAPHLPEGLLAEALAAVRSTNNERHRVATLAALAPHLPENLRQQALAQALDAARSIESDRPRAEALAILAPYLPQHLLTLVLATAQTLPEQSRLGDRPRAEALAPLAPHLPENMRQQALAQALDYTRSTENEYHRARALAALAPHLAQNLLPQALAAARNIKRKRLRAKVLADLASHLPKETRAQVLAEALASVYSIKHQWHRAKTLIFLAPYLPEEMLFQPLAEALEAASNVEDEEARVRVLASLAPYLPEHLLLQALGAASKIKDKGHLIRALAALAPHLPEHMLPQALAAVHSIERERYRAEALSSLVPHLPEEARDQALTEALAAARSIDSNWHRAEAVIALTSHLPQHLLSQALDVARSIKDERHRAKALAALAPHLPEEERDQALTEALAAAQSIRDTDDRAKTLAALAPHLPQDLLAQILDIARELPEQGWLRSSPRAEALAALAPHLAKALLTEALDVASGIENEYFRSLTLAALAPHLPENLLTQVLAATRSIKDERHRAKILAALPPHLPDELRRQVLAATCCIESDWLRAEVLAALASHLPEEIRQQVLAAAQSAENEWYRAEVLAALVPHLPQDLLAEALDAVSSIQDEWHRARALDALAPHLPQDLLAKALDAARSIRDERHRARALAALAPHRPEELLAEALAAARGIQEERYRARALAALAPHRPEELLVEALAAARSIRDEDDRARALAALAPHRPEDERAKALAEALAAARSIRHEAARAEALAALAPHLPEEMRQQTLVEALDAARSIKDERYRARALAALAPGLARLPCATLYPLWAETLSTLARRTRSDLLSDLRALQKVIFALGGEAAVAETARAILDVGRWWP